jgi:cobalt-zinc-cadmium efflux system protein
MHAHSHSCSHHHGHSHSHDPQDKHRHHSHHHVPDGYSKRLMIGAAINLAFVAVELTYGFISGSLALIADAAHNFSDVIGLLLAWGGAYLARAKPTDAHTYGFSGASILAALGNAGLLLVATGGIIVQAVQRFFHPAPIETGPMIWVACIGILINGTTAWVLHRDQHTDLNARGAYLHMVADTAISLGVVLAGIAVMYTGWLWLDPVTSLVIAFVILIGTWGLAKESLHLSLAGVPKHIDRQGVHDYLAGLPGVTEVHDLHIWAMSTTQSALTVHLMRPQCLTDDKFLHEVADELEKRFNIQHPTIQVERGNNPVACRFSPKDVI